ncbi:fatty-acid--CoA ligase [Acrocarpospora phusangensis]|uniref:Fatty-acid--CoA ligase n=1 Tax=Acrocarpospora phusangensis TaxID=1070424 RepID=A0A919UQD4_9ACTN|nr:AMP-binding protein [Acrocarpospora phusangensis]GIH26732.1 fatty-acid--CoA ligase [Acrocarpospora phusangensis]
MPLSLLLERAAARFGDRVAVEGPDGTRTFAGLADRVSRLASALLALGLRPGERVLELQPNGCGSIESDLALAWAGLVRVPLNPRLGPREWEGIAGDCGARALLYDAAFAAETGALRDGLDVTVASGERGSGREHSREDLIRDAQPGLPRFASSLDDLAGLAYSSGTTGRPKGAMRTHRNRIAAALAMTQEVLGGPPGPDAVFLHAGPVIHTSGLFVLPFLMSGARQLLLGHAGAAEIAGTVRARGVTHTALVPTMIARLLDLPDAGPLASLRMLAYAGAPMPEAHIRRAAEALTPRLVQYYGLVEAMPPLTVLDEADHARGLRDRPDLLRSAGRPCLAVELRVVDGDGVPVGAGVDGEVEVRGDPVMPGYWRAAGREDLGKAVAGGWLRTGDIGRLGDGGRLWLTDRKNDMIITGGYNVYPREIEDVVTGLGGVAQAAAVGLPDPGWGQRVAVAYTCAPGYAVGPEEVLARCRAALPSHKRPKQARHVPVLPLNATGKISRRDVVRLLTEGPGGGTG